jgi:hypothetical protein
MIKVKSTFYVSKIKAVEVASIILVLFVVSE